MTVGKDKKMTKEEFANLKKGQTIVALVKRGRTLFREPFTIINNLSTLNGYKVLVTSVYGIIDHTDVDFLKKADVKRMLAEENARHEKRKMELSEMLKEAK